MPTSIGRRALPLPALIAAIAIGACGGAPPQSPAGRPRAADGSARANRSAPTALVAPVLQARLTARLPAPVQDPAIAAVDGGVVLMGGLDQADVSVSDVTLARGNRAQRVGALPQALHDAAAATLAHSSYLLGGGEPSHAEILAVDRAGTARLMGHLPAGASDLAAATLGSTIYAVGGYTGTQPLDTIVGWSGRGSGRILAVLPHPVRYAAVAAAAGRLIIAGGTSDRGATGAVYSFDPATDRVNQIGELPHGLTHAAAATFGGVAYVIGGRVGARARQTAQILAIDPGSGHVRPAGTLPMALSDAGAAAVPDGVILAGGRELGGALSDRIYLLRSAL